MPAAVQAVKVICPTARLMLWGVNLCLTAKSCQMLLLRQFFEGQVGEPHGNVEFATEFNRQTDVLARQRQGKIGRLEAPRQILAARPRCAAWRW